MFVFYNYHLNMYMYYTLTFYTIQKFNCNPDCIKYFLKHVGKIIIFPKFKFVPSKIILYYTGSQSIFIHCY